jgi:hypothetical protein
MFFEIRYQTGEKKAIANEMKLGRIPALDVSDMEDFDAFVDSLAEVGIYKTEIPYDKTARDRVKEPEFEFRAAFCEGSFRQSKAEEKKLMYIDVFFEPDLDETYDSVCEI